jgi:non-homologous end joining protein Ku
VSRPHSDQIEDRTEPVGPVCRIKLRPYYPTTGEEIEIDEVVRGYEYERGQYVTFTPDELKALDLESSKVINLEDVCSPRRSRRGLFQQPLLRLYPTAKWRPRRSV